MHWSLDYGSSTGWVKHLIVTDIGGIERIVKMIRHDEQCSHLNRFNFIFQPTAKVVGGQVRLTLRLQSVLSAGDSAITKTTTFTNPHQKPNCARPSPATTRQSKDGNLRSSLTTPHRQWMIARFFKRIPTLALRRSTGPVLDWTQTRAGTYRSQESGLVESAWAELRLTR